jgi:hypothetical protein
VSATLRPRDRQWRRLTGAWLIVAGLAPVTVAGLPAGEIRRDDAGTAAPVALTPQVLGDDELVIREIFQSHLPTTLKRKVLRLGVHPHLGDLGSREHLRVTSRMRYGYTENLEVSASFDGYVSHGRGAVAAFDRSGIASLQLGAKGNLGQTLLRGWDTAIGFDYEFPTGRPPAEMTDGLRHFAPYVTFSRRLEFRRGLRVFWGLRLDAVDDTGVPGTFRRNALRDSSTGVTAGFVIDRRNWHYTLEASVDSTRLLGGPGADVFMVRPGVIWEILSRRHPDTRSNWVVGAAVTGRSGPDGTSLGASLKLRYNFDLKRPAPPHR